MCRVAAIHFYRFSLLLLFNIDSKTQWKFPALISKRKMQMLIQIAQQISVRWEKTETKFLYWNRTKEHVDSTEIRMQNVQNYWSPSIWCNRGCIHFRKKKIFLLLFCYRWNDLICDLSLFLLLSFVVVVVVAVGYHSRSIAHF